jgi:monolysocardiolipin acyltransferase
MPEPRSWPRFIPRAGARIKITYGSSITPRIQPLVDEWREIASREKGTIGIGGDWEKRGDSPKGEDQRVIRSRGDLAGGKEEEVRVKIVQELQEAVRELGEQVEGKEGRFERKEWCQSRAGVHLQSGEGKTRMSPL